MRRSESNSSYTISNLNGFRERIRDGVGGEGQRVQPRAGGADIGDQPEAETDRRAGAVAKKTALAQAALRGQAAAAAGQDPSHAG